MIEREGEEKKTVRSFGYGDYMRGKIIYFAVRRLTFFLRLDNRKRPLHFLVAFSRRSVLDGYAKSEIDGRNALFTYARSSRRHR